MVDSGALAVGAARFALRSAEGRTPLMRSLRRILGTGVLSVVLASGCGPALPTGQAPTTPPPSQFMPGYRLEPGTTLRYQVRRSSSWTAAGRYMREARTETAMAQV